MIEVTLDNLTLTVKGHARFAEKGQDIICAAASMLAYTLIETLERMRGMLHSIYEIDGDTLTVQAYPREGVGETMARTAYSTVMNGYRLLAGNYPEHLTLSNGGL